MVGSIQIMRTHHVGIVVSDLQQSLDWYQSILGFEEIARDYVEALDLTIVYIRSGETELELFTKGGSVASRPEEKELFPSFGFQGLRHLCFEVPNPVVAWDQARALGADLANAPTQNEALGVRYCFIRDPDGILIEFLTPLEKLKS